MKTKFTFFLLVLFVCFANGQNVTMAKAFFKKAQKEYEAKNYEASIKLIEKAKVHLDGATNPDIIYLEAKARFEHDVNINKTKALFSQFINQADQKDDRVEEISSILVDIQTSDNFYDNGNRKTRTRFSNYGNKVIAIYNSDGTTLKELTYCKVTTTYSNLKTEVSFNLCEIAYYEVLNLKSFIHRIERIKKGAIDEVIYYQNGLKKVLIDKQDWHKFTEYSISIYNKNEEEILSYQYTLWDNSNSYYTLVKDYRDKANFYNSFQVIHFTAFSDIDYIEEHKNIKIGVLKKLKMSYNKGKGHTILFLNDEGIPLRKEYYKKNKLKNSKVYNAKNNTWSEQ